MRREGGKIEKISHVLDVAFHEEASPIRKYHRKIRLSSAMLRSLSIIMMRLAGSKAKRLKA